MPSDQEVIAQVLAGQTNAYAELVSRYERLARAAAIRIVRDGHAADDVAQEAFVAAYKSLSSLRDRSNFSAWLLGIVRRRAATAVKLDRRRPSIGGDLDAHAAPPGAHPSAESLELLEFVEQLPDQERVVIGLKHFEGRSVQEIAEITGRPVGTVTKQLSRARQRLHDWLTQEHCEHERIQRS
ncbi:MAG TPA: sigma-70 family RNA polymerase sigma factor [Pirellulales bacterium]|nr:sigma-70 family RNA polymerase sigma factor [Pirellulales bacterium]